MLLENLGIGWTFRQAAVRTSTEASPNGPLRTLKRHADVSKETHCQHDTYFEGREISIGLKGSGPRDPSIYTYASGTDNGTHSCSPAPLRFVIFLFGVGSFDLLALHCDRRRPLKRLELEPREAGRNPFE